MEVLMGKSWENHGNMFYEWRFSVGKSYKKGCSSAVFDGWRAICKNDQKLVCNAI